MLEDDTCLRLYLYLLHCYASHEVLRPTYYSIAMSCVCDILVHLISDDSIFCIQNDSFEYVLQLINMNGLINFNVSWYGTDRTEGCV